MLDMLCGASFTFFFYNIIYINNKMICKVLHIVCSKCNNVGGLVWSDEGLIDQKLSTLK